MVVNFSFLDRAYWKYEQKTESALMKQFATDWPSRQDAERGRLAVSDNIQFYCSDGQPRLEWVNK
jgi:hypothetical protein